MGILRKNLPSSALAVLEKKEMIFDKFQTYFG